jgi:hypothetical protein
VWRTRYSPPGMSLGVRFILWGTILLAAVGIWLLLAERRRSKFRYALAVAVSAAALSAAVCGLTDSPIKFTIYTVTLTPILLVVLLWWFPYGPAHRRGPPI